MFDFTRLRGPLSAIVAVTAALTLASAVLSAVMPRVVHFPACDSTMEVGAYDDVGASIAAFLKHQQQKPAEGPLGVLLGSSSLGYGVDPAVLSAARDLPQRWVSLRGDGASVADLRDVLVFAVRCGLKPDVLVLGIHPGMLACSKSFLSDNDDVALSPLSSHAMSGRVMAVKKDVESLVQASLNREFPNRTRINHYVRLALFQARVRMLESLGVTTGLLFRPNDWEIPGWVQGPHFSQAESLARFDTVFQKRGWLSADAYGPACNGQALTELIGDAAALSAQVIVVVMPETSYLREMIPPEASGCLSTALADPAISGKFKVVDFRSAVADELFVDTCHLDPQGIEMFSRQLRQALSQ